MAITYNRVGWNSSTNENPPAINGENLGALEDGIVALNKAIDDLESQMTEDNERVKILDKATTAEASAGTSNTKWMTPATTKTAIASLASTVTNTGKTVLDARTGKEISIVTSLKELGQSSFGYTYNQNYTTYNTPEWDTTQFGQLISNHTSNNMYILGRCYKNASSSSNSKRQPAVGRVSTSTQSIKTMSFDKIQTDSNFTTNGSGGNNDRFSYTVNYSCPCVSLSGNIFLSNANNGIINVSRCTLVDTEKNIYYDYDVSPTNPHNLGAFCTTSFWGVVGNSGAGSAITVSYKDRTDYGTFSTATIAATYSNDFQLVGVYSNTLYYIYRSSSNTYTYYLGSFNFSTLSLSPTLLTFNASSVGTGTVIMRVICHSDTAAYIMVVHTTSKTVATNCLKIVLSSSVNSNWGNLILSWSTALYSQLFSTSKDELSTFNAKYIGNYGNLIYFIVNFSSSSKFTLFNCTTLSTSPSLSWSSLIGDVNGGDVWNYWNISLRTRTVSLPTMPNLLPLFKCFIDISQSKAILSTYKEDVSSALVGSITSLVTRYLVGTMPAHIGTIVNKEYCLGRTSIDLTSKNETYDMYTQYFFAGSHKIYNVEYIEN